MKSPDQSWNKLGHHARWPLTLCAQISIMRVILNPDKPIYKVIYNTNLKHMLKQSFATPCSLASLMDVEIQHTQGMYFILNTLHVLM